jgi:(p)ppGpp synthase/HD superfamily hydrolase
MSNKRSAESSLDTEIKRLKSEEITTFRDYNVPLSDICWMNTDYLIQYKKTLYEKLNTATILHNKYNDLRKRQMNLECTFDDPYPDGAQIKILQMEFDERIKHFSAEMVELNKQIVEITGELERSKQELTEQRDIILMYTADLEILLVRIDARISHLRSQRHRRPYITHYKSVQETIDKLHQEVELIGMTLAEN